MTLVQGELKLVTDAPDEVSQVWIQAPKERLHGTGMITDGRASEQVKNGVVSFNALPGVAVMVLLVNGIPSLTVKLLIPDKANATLRECIEAVGLADDGTLSELEELALEVARIAAQIASADRLEVWASETASAASQAQLSNVEAGLASNHATAAASNAKQSESNAKQSEINADSAASAAQNLAESASLAAKSATGSAVAAKDSETNSAIYESHSLAAAERAEFAAEETIQQVEGDFATRNYVDTATGVIASRVNNFPTWPQATSIAFGAAAALSGGSGSPVGGASGQWDESKPITLWGDSAIDRGETGQRLADGINNVLRQDVVENAVGGSTLDNTLLRMGGIKLWVTPEGGKIPAATNPVMLDLHGADVGMMSGGKVPMTYAGVKGVFEYSNTVEGGGFVGARFTRDVAGGEVTVSSPTLLESRTQFDPYATHIIVSGGNDRRAAVKTVPEDDLRGHLVAGYVRMVEMIAASPTKHVLIGGVKGRGDTEIGDWYHKLIMEVNNWLKQMYPHIFIDRNRWLCEHAPRLLNIELSAEDKRRAEAWLPPKAVLQDATHTVPELRVIEGEHLWAPELAIRGWAQATQPLERNSMDITNRVPYDLQQRITDLENRLNALEP